MTRRLCGAFEVYRLARWADAGHGYLNMRMWDKGADQVPERDELAGMECWFGLDMALNEDLASLAMLFKDDDRGVLWVPVAALDD